jgi:hypothetical protein
LTTVSPVLHIRNTGKLGKKGIFEVFAQIGPMGKASEDKLCFSNSATSELCACLPWESVAVPPAQLRWPW